MGIFGWSLPPGCGTLPGEEYDQLTNEDVEQAFANYEGPWDLYRQTYKYVACGPMVGFTIAYYIEPTDKDPGQDVTKTFYGDDLRLWGTWKDLAEQGALIVAIGVSSIVEGVDWDVPYREVETDPDKLADKAQEDEAPARRAGTTVERAGQAGSETQAGEQFVGIVLGKRIVVQSSNGRAGQI